jgi:hypothetical protein
MATWNNLLDNRLGINAATRNKLGWNNIASMADLLAMEEETIGQTVASILKYPHPNRHQGAQVHPTPKTVEDLKLVRKWAILQTRMGIANPNPAHLTAAELNNTRLRVAELKAYAVSVKDQDVQKPPKLKKMSEWVKFWEAVQTYFGSIRGAAEVPLEYVGLGIWELGYGTWNLEQGNVEVGSRN